MIQIHRDLFEDLIIEAIQRLHPDDPENAEKLDFLEQIVNEMQTASPFLELVEIRCVDSG